MFIVKAHKIITALAIGAIILTTMLGFIGQIDILLNLDLFPQSWETVMRLAVWAIGCVALGSGSASLLLSLYRSAEKR